MSYSNNHICINQLTTVNVLPAPVCPYAKMQTLMPSRTDLTKGPTSAKTSSIMHTSISSAHKMNIIGSKWGKCEQKGPWVEDGRKTLSNWYTFLFLEATMWISWSVGVTIVPRIPRLFFPSFETRGLTFFSSFDTIGLIRQNTRMFPS